MDDKESFINNHEKAPLIELDDFLCPSASNCFYVQTYDNKKIRIALWNKESDKGLFFFNLGEQNLLKNIMKLFKNL